MHRSLRLFYCTVMDYPSSMASSIQQIKTAHAMGRVGACVIFCIKDSRGTLSDPQIILDYYGLTKHPNFLLETISTQSGRHRYRMYLVKLLLKWPMMLKRYKPEAILTRESRVILMLYPFARWAGITLVFESHDLANLTSWESFRKRNQLFQRWALQRADVVVTVTDFCKQDMVNIGINPSKILVAPDAADLWSYSEPKSQLNSSEPVKLTYVGSMHPERGCDVLIRALPYIRSSVIAVLVGGTNNQIEMMTKLANDLGVADQVHLVGSVPHRYIKQWIEASDILIMPTIDSLFGRRYTSPMKLFEYMASMRPIITSNLPTVREILDEGSATFFTAGNPEDLARAVVDTITNWKEALVKAQRAFQIFARHYTFEKRAAKILDFIQHIRGEKAPLPEVVGAPSQPAQSI